MTRHKKSRDQPILDYYESLIREWFTADLRRRTYTKKSDKEYWGKVCGFKKEKILDIATRNHLPNIFDNDAAKRDYYEIFYPKGKVPIIVKTPKDLKYYYSVGSDVVVETAGATHYGRIQESNIKDGKVTVTIRNTEQVSEFAISTIRRIV